tara:strand:+ start:66 stop:239 length:174 start_codon:yes stop_codon:yes gene_type:complete
MRVNPSPWTMSNPLRESPMTPVATAVLQTILHPFTQLHQPAYRTNTNEMRNTAGQLE